MKDLTALYNQALEEGKITQESWNAGCATYGLSNAGGHAADRCMVHEYENKLGIFAGEEKPIPKYALYAGIAGAVILLLVVLK